MGTMSFPDLKYSGVSPASTDDDNDEVLSDTNIIIIAVCGGVGLIVIIAFVYFVVIKNSLGWFGAKATGGFDGSTASNPMRN